MLIVLVIFDCLISQRAVTGKLTARRPRAGATTVEVIDRGGAPPKCVIRKLGKEAANIAVGLAAINARQLVPRIIYR